MKNGIPKRPVLLAAFLGNLITGDEKHQQDGPLPKETRTALEATKAKLESLNGAVQTSKGQYRQNTKDRRDYLASAQILAEKYRAAVFAIHGPKDPALVDYALATRRKPHKAGSAEASNGSQAHEMERKLERAEARVLRKRAKLAEAQVSLSKAEAILAQRKADVTKVAPVTPTEPNPTSEPTSESGTK